MRVLTMVVAVLVLFAMVLVGVVTVFKVSPPVGCLVVVLFVWAMWETLGKVDTTDQLFDPPPES